MGALVLKSRNALSEGIPPLDYSVYKSRVESDGGYIVDEQRTIEALKFLKQNNISTSQVLLGTSAAWGVKTNDEGVLTKLYNLGDAAGDLEANVGAPTLLTLNTEHSTAPALEFRGTSQNYLRSVGGQKGSFESLTYANFNKPPVDFDYSTHNAAGTIVVHSNELLNESNGRFVYLKDTSDTVTGSVLQIHAYRWNKDSSNLPDDFGHTYAFNGGETSFLRTTSDVVAGNKSYSSVFILHRNKPSYLYDRDEGVVLSSVKPYIIDLPDYSFHVGTSVSGITGGLTSPLISDVFETWYIANLTNEQAGILSQRGTMFDSQ